MYNIADKVLVVIINEQSQLHIEVKISSHHK